MSFDITAVESEQVCFRKFPFNHFESVAFSSLQVLQVAVISDEGNLSLFKFPLTNHVTAPVSAHSTVQFVSITQKVCF